MAERLAEVDRAEAATALARELTELCAARATELGNAWGLATAMLALDLAQDSLRHTVGQLPKPTQHAIVRQRDVLRQELRDAMRGAGAFGNRARPAESEGA